MINRNPMTKDRAIQRAQDAANRANSPMAVLNLNPISPLYVVRDWDDRFIGSRDLVARITPATIDQGG